MVSRRISPSMVVAIIALIAATAGTTLAATGQLVNIADPTTATNVAKVDSSGALKTLAAGTVNARPQQPTKPFDGTGLVPNFFAGGRKTLLQTSGSLAVTRLNYSSDIRNASRWEIYLRFAPIPAGGTCQPFADGSRQVARASLGPGESYSDTFPTPLVLQPAAAGQSWCLVGSAGPASSGSTDQGGVAVDFSGFVVSGTVATPASRAARARSNRPG